MKHLLKLYHDFVEILNKTQSSDDPTNILKQTFSRLLQEFLQDKRKINRMMKTQEKIADHFSNRIMHNFRKFLMQ